MCGPEPTTGGGRKPSALPTPELRAFCRGMRSYVRMMDDEGEHGVATLLTIGLAHLEEACDRYDRVEVSP